MNFIKRLTSLSLLNLIIFCPNFLKIFIKKESVAYTVFFSSFNDITSNLEHEF